MNDYIWVVWVLTICSWVAVPFFNHHLTNKRDKRSERNKTIDSIESLFEKMNKEALSFYESESFEVNRYYSLISYNQQLRMLVSRVSYFEDDYVFPRKKIKEIRQITTDDELREKHRVAGMQMLLAYQIELINDLPKKF